MTDRRANVSRRTFVQWAAGGTGALLGASLLPGCGRVESEGAAITQGAANAVSGTPHYGGRVRFGVLEGNQAGNLDAHKPIGSGSFRGWALYSKLWEWDLEAQPRLALAEEASVNADGTEWIIRLRPDLEFHHGKTITADDVIFSLKRLTDPDLASPYAGYLYSLERNGIEKLDERTVRIPFARGRGLIALAECWMSWGGIVPTDYDPVQNVVGAGPYRHKSFTPGQRSLFTRFENYYKPGQPYLEEVEILDFKDQTSRLQALQAGQIDIATNIAHEQLPFLSSDPRFRVVSSPTDSWQSFDMNTQKPPFDDVRVRQAFRLIADREELVARVLHGHGRVANDLYSPSDPVFNHSIPQRRQDLEEARRLLRAAGHGNGLEVDLVTTGGVGANAALVFAQQARLAGVKINVRRVDQSIFNGPQRNSWSFSTGSGVSRPFLLTVLQHDGPYAVGNKTNFRDERFGELITAALAQPDLEQRRALVHEAQQIQHERGGLLIWGYSNVLDVLHADIEGVAPCRTGFAAWRTDRIWRRA